MRNGNANIGMDKKKSECWSNWKVLQIKARMAWPDRESSLYVGAFGLSSEDATQNRSSLFSFLFFLFARRRSWSVALRGRVTPDVYSRNRAMLLRLLLLLLILLLLLLRVLLVLLMLMVLKTC